MHQTVTNHDAIGNDIELMYRLLHQKYECKVFAENRFNQNVEYMLEEELESFLKEEENLIIYHHSVFWEKGEEYLRKAHGKIIIRYHNITPPEFFQPYNGFHTEQCAKGREQTKRFCSLFPDAFWMVDSEYNAKDISQIREEKIGVCPPFNKIEQWKNALLHEEILRKLLHSEEVNLLFVGRIAPNKGHLFLLEIMKYYCGYYDNKIKLRIIGKFDNGLAKYNNEIEERINKYHLQNNIEFIGEINDAALLSYYLGSDLFICASEHEGFCVPIVEAQYFNLPIIARNSSAIPETLGVNQIILQENPKDYAAAIRLLMDNEDYKHFLRIYGRDNYLNRFTIDKISEIFSTLLEAHIGVTL